MAAITEDMRILQKIFNEANKKYYGGKLQKPAILVQNQGNHKVSAYGWCTTAKVWRDNEGKDQRYEITITAEYLNRDTLDVITTMLHEMVHLYHLESGIKGVSRGGTYHNETFKKDAELRGLKIDRHPAYGWTISELSDEGREWAEGLGIPRNTFRLGRVAMRDVGGSSTGGSSKGEAGGSTGGASKKSSQHRYVCPECGIIIRATKEVNILCGDCGCRLERRDK